MIVVSGVRISCVTVARKSDFAAEAATAASRAMAMSRSACLRSVTSNRLATTRSSSTRARISSE